MADEYSYVPLDAPDSGYKYVELDSKPKSDDYSYVPVEPATPTSMIAGHVPLEPTPPVPQPIASHTPMAPPPQMAFPPQMPGQIATVAPQVPPGLVSDPGDGTVTQLPQAPIMSQVEWALKHLPPTPGTLPWAQTPLSPDAKLTLQGGPQNLPLYGPTPGTPSVLDSDNPAAPPPAPIQLPAGVGPVTSTPAEMTANGILRGAYELYNQSKGATLDRLRDLVGSGGDGRDLLELASGRDPAPFIPPAQESQLKSVARGVAQSGVQLAAAATDPEMILLFAAPELLPENLATMARTAVLAKFGAEGTQEFGDAVRVAKERWATASPEERTQIVERGVGGLSMALLPALHARGARKAIYAESRAEAEQFIRRGVEKLKPEGQGVDTTNMKVPPGVAEEIARENASAPEGKVPAPEAEVPPAAEDLSREVGPGAVAGEVPPAEVEAGQGSARDEAAVPARGPEAPADEAAAPAGNEPGGAAGAGGRVEAGEVPGGVERPPAEWGGKRVKQPSPNDKLVESPERYDERIRIADEHQKQKEEHLASGRPQEGEGVAPFDPKAVATLDTAAAEETARDIENAVTKHAPEIAGAPMNRHGVGVVPMLDNKGVETGSRLWFVKDKQGDVVAAAQINAANKVVGIAKKYHSDEYPNGRFSPLDRLNSKLAEAGVIRTAYDTWSEGGAKMVGERMPTAEDMKLVNSLRGEERTMASDRDIAFLPGVDRAAAEGEAPKSEHFLNADEIHKGIEDLRAGEYHTPEAEAVTRYAKDHAEGAHDEENLQNRANDLREKSAAEVRAGGAAPREPGPEPTDTAEGEPSAREVGGRPVEPAAAGDAAPDRPVEPERGPATPVELKSKDDVQKFREAGGVAPEQAKADADVIDSWATTWARISKRPVSEYYDGLKAAYSDESGQLQQTVNLRKSGKTLGKKGRVSLYEAAKFLEEYTRKGWGALTSTDEKAIVRRGVDFGLKELKAQLATDNSGATWYREDVAKMKREVAKIRPELEDPTKLSLFTTVLGITSPGVNPYVNLKQALEIWDRYDKTGRFPLDQGRLHPMDHEEHPGEPVQWSGTSAGTALAKLDSLVRAMGEKGALDWLHADHKVKELNGYLEQGGLPGEVDGKMNDKKPGFFVFGPKAGPFTLNLHGRREHLTADLWFSRTWNRWQGNLLARDADGNLMLNKKGVPYPVDAPRGPGEKLIQQKVVQRIAKKADMDPADVQAVLWFHEQQLWRQLGVKGSEGSYGESIDRITRDRAKAAGADADLAAGVRGADDGAYREAEGGREAPVVRGDSGAGEVGASSAARESEAGSEGALNEVPHPIDVSAVKLENPPTQGEAYEERQAREARNAHARGDAGVAEMMSAQPVGTERVIDGQTYRTGPEGAFRLATVPIEQITQRAQDFRKPGVVDRYANDFTSGRDVQPVQLDPAKDGGWFARDGNHRIDAAERAGLTHIQAWVPLEDVGERAAKAYEANGGGFTMHPDTGEEPTDGYVVSPYKGRELTLDHPPTAEDLNNYVADNRDLLNQPGNRLGGWKADEDRHVIDISRQVPTAAEAERIGRANDQEAYWDVKNQRSVPIESGAEPTEQKSVTLNQSASDNKKMAVVGSDSFKRWFGSSEVREERTSSRDTRPDEELLPKVVYHGTNADFDTFEPRVGTNSGTFGSWPSQREGYFFAEDPKTAGSFAESHGEGQNVKPVYLSIKNSADLREGFPDELLDELKKEGLNPNYYLKLGPQKVWEAFDHEYGGKELVAALKKLGYDGARIYEPSADDAPGDSWVAFDPSQIKSATGNSGAFDPSDPSILKQGPAESPRASYTYDADGTRLIRMGEKADGTSWTHEAVHDSMRKLAELVRIAAPEFKETVLRHMRSFNRFVGAADDATPDDWTREQHEKAAAGQERYMRDGKAPTPALKQAFEYLRGIFRQVYASVRGTPLEGKLNPDVRAAYDWWMGKEEAPERVAGGVGDTAAGTVGSLRRGEVADQPTNVPIGERIKALLGRPAVTAGGGSVVPDARTTYDVMGNLKDIFGGFGLNQLQQATPSVVSLVRERAAAAQKTVSLLRMINPQILDALEAPKTIDELPAKADGSKNTAADLKAARDRTIEQFNSALAQGRLIGVKDKLEKIRAKIDEDPSDREVQELADLRDKMADPDVKAKDFTPSEQALRNATNGLDIQGMDNDELRDALKDVKFRALVNSGALDTMIEALDGRKGFETFDENGNVDGMRDLADEWRTQQKSLNYPSSYGEGPDVDAGHDAEAIQNARDFLGDTLDTWKRNIGRVELRHGQPETSESFLYPGPENDAAAQRFHDDYVDSPQFQKALEIYKKHIEPAFKRAHSLNEGFFSDDLGPLDTYYPLSNVNDQAEAARVNRTTQYVKPKNANNYFTTGLGDYDVTTEAMRKNLARAISQNGKAGVLGALSDEGLLQPARPGESLPDTMIYKGVEYKAERVPVGVTKIIDKDGKVQNVPSAMANVPAWVAKELGPILDPKHQAEDERRFLNSISSAVTAFNMGGPTDAVFHSANMLATLVTKCPIVGTSLLSKTASALPLAKSIAAIVNLATYDVNTPERQARLEEMIKNGQIPTRYGTSTWSKAYAAEHPESEYEGFRSPVHDTKTGRDLPLIGTKRLRMPLAFGPMVFGPEGVDIRARLLMDEIGDHIAEKAGIEMTPDEKFQWTSQLGNYVYELEGRIERAAKATGLAPFFTAGRQMNENALSALNPFAGKLPSSRIPESQRNGYRAMQITSGLVGYAATWAIASKLYRGKWPWDDDQAKLFQIPLNDDDRNSTVGKALWGDDVSKTGYVNLGFLNPLMGRGLRLTGLGQLSTGALQGRSFDNAFDRGTIDTLNTFAHPLLGPPIHTAMNSLFGTEAYLTRLTQNGRFAPQLQSTIQGKAMPGPAGWAQKGLHALVGANPIARNIARAQEQGQPALRVLADTVAPNLIKGPLKADYSPLETYMSDYAQEHPFPGEPSTPERRQGRDLATSLTSQLRRAYDTNDTAKATELEKAADDALEAKTIVPSEYDRIFKNAGLTKHAGSFSRLPLPDAIKAYGKANDAEKVELADALAKKVAGDKWRQDLSDDEADAITKQVDDLLEQADAAELRLKRK